ncbi:MAG: hypothetical protein JWP34_5092, partial [Massilia sp.]|nr:hypothetical protein [Massilia sp.]
MLQGAAVAADLKVHDDCGVPEMVQSQQCRLLVLGQSGDQAVVPVEEDVTVESADPPQQDRRENPVAQLLAVGLHTSIVGFGQLVEGDHPPAPAAGEPVEVTIGISGGDDLLPSLGRVVGWGVPFEAVNVWGQHPGAVMQGPAGFLGQPVGEVVRPSGGPGRRIPVGDIAGVGCPQVRDRRAVSARPEEADSTVVPVHAGEQDVPASLMQQHPLARSDLHPEPGPPRLGRGHDQPVPEHIGGVCPVVPLHGLIIDRGAGGELSGIDAGHQFAVGGAGGGDIVVAFFELQAQVD